MPGSFTFALDGMRGDYGTDPAIAGAVKSLLITYVLRIILVGDERIIDQGLTHTDQSSKDRITVIHTDEFIKMDEDIVSAIRNKKNSSMRLSINQVKTNSAHACVSAGNTGALMALSKLILKTVDGIERPAITALWPNPKGNSVVLDLGANIDVSPNQLIQFGIMGYAYAICVLKKEDPKIAILNIGHEEIKGSNNLQEANDKLNNICLLYTSDAADE